VSATIRDLARARLAAADHLDAKIAELGVAYRRYLEATAALEQQSGTADLQRYLEVPLILALAKAGFSPLLEQKFVGTPPGLRVTVETQHRTLGLEGDSQGPNR
jgi:hypothetical protein